MTYFNRTLEPFLKKISKQFPVLLIAGPRQVGKTTILKHLSLNSRQYITLDDPKLANLAKQDPALFLQRFKPPILIDEIQYAPELLPHIKMMVDQQRKVGQFWLTGSQQFQLMQGVTESLAGRVAIINLLGFSLKEIEKQADVHQPFLPTKKQLDKRLKNSSSVSLTELYQLIWYGFYPGLWVSKKASWKKQMASGAIDRDLFYNSYIQTYLQRDVRDLANVGDESNFLRFLRSTAARTGQLLNMTDMARDADISVTTAKRWLSILKASGIIYLLEAYHSNTTKRLVKAPKLYFLDTGLCAYLTEWSSPQTLEAGAMSGAILETFIFNEILKSYWHNGKRKPLYYFRDKDKKEIDLLILKDQEIYPLEFKKTASPNKKIISQFDLLKKLKKPIQNGGVICLSETLLPLSQKHNAIPVSLL